VSVTDLPMLKPGSDDNILNKRRNIWTMVYNNMKPSDSEPQHTFGTRYSEGLRLDDLGSISVRGKIFLFAAASSPAEVHPVSYRMGTGGSFHGSKAAGA
jgi:hypothetical protein